MELYFYDSGGKPVIWTPDEEHIFSWAGKPLAFMRNGKVYRYSGRSWVGSIMVGFEIEEMLRCSSHR